jgi:hypothetical protein
VAVALAAVAAVGLGVALTRDGGGPQITKAAYSTGVQAVLVRLASDFRAAGTADTSATLRRMKASLDRAAGHLDQVRPPADASSEHRALVSELRDFASQVDILRASVDLGDVPTIVSHLAGVTAPAALNHTLDSLTAKGYDISVRVAGVKRSAGTGG